MNHYDMEWTRQQLLDMGARKIVWSVGNEAYQLHLLVVKLHVMGRENCLHCFTIRDATRQEELYASDSGARSTTGRALARPCAAPVLKATHAAERMAPNGVVVANEPISGRANMLASNRGRCRSTM